MNKTRISIPAVSQEVPSLDVLKYIASFLIVSIHAGLHSTELLNFYYIEFVCRFAVPLFFTMSSYFLFKKVNAKSYESEGLIKKYLKRNLFLYFYWSLVYSPFIVASLWKENFSLKAIFNYFREFFIRGNSYGQLWFIAALVQGMFVIYILRRFLKIRSIFIFSVIVYLTGLAIMPYYGFFETMIYSNRVTGFLFTGFSWLLGGPFNGYFYGLPFLALGALLAEKQLRLSKIACLAGTMVFVALSFAETTFLRHTGYMFEALQLSLLPAAFFIFSFVRQVRVEPSPKYIVLRKLSSLVYFVHFFILEILNLGLSRAGVSFETVFNIPFIKILTVFALSNLVSFAILKVSDIIPFIKRTY